MPCILQNALKLRFQTGDRSRIPIEANKSSCRYSFLQSRQYDL